MPPRKIKDVQSGFPLIRWVQKRLYKENKNWLSVMTGETGSGKSWSALRIAKEIDPNFDVSKVVLDPVSFMESLVDKKWKQGDCVVWDEAGASLSSKEYMTVVNRAVEDILETFRRKNIAVIFTVPSQKNIDKDVRRLLHSYLQTKTINYAWERVNIKWLRMDYNPKMDKIYYHYHKVEKEKSELPKKIKNVWIGKPDKDLLESYENKRDNYQEDIQKKRLKKIERTIKKSKDKKKRVTKKEKIKRSVKEKDDISIENLAEEFDTSKKYVRQILNDNA